MHLNPFNNRDGLKRKIGKKLCLRIPGTDRIKSNKDYKHNSKGHYNINGNGNYKTIGNESYINYQNENSIYPYEDYKDYNNTIITTNAQEEIFCSCQKALEDEMIECENKSCKFKWFHFSCVGIEVAPEGDWYCMDCIKTKQKKKKR